MVKSVASKRPVDDLRLAPQIVNVLRRERSFVAGVPDSLLGDLELILRESTDLPHIVAANEGLAVSAAAGWHLATGRVPVVYMQNSGLGNAINPLLSLAHRDVYGMPMVLLIGLRGWDGDAPQHLPDGRATRELLRDLDVRIHSELSSDTSPPLAASRLRRALRLAAELEHPVALLIHRGALDHARRSCSGQDGQLTRASAIQTVVRSLPEDCIVVASTGRIAREYEHLTRTAVLPERQRFLVVGSMGHAASIAFGLCFSDAGRWVVCLDGDGALVMHLGILATVGRYQPHRLVHVLLNNGMHESVGGAPTGLDRVDHALIARTCGYRTSFRVTSRADVVAAIQSVITGMGPAFIEISVGPGSLEKVGRPSHDLRSKKQAFMEAFEDVMHESQTPTDFNHAHRNRSRVATRRKGAIQ